MKKLTFLLVSILFIGQSCQPKPEPKKEKAVEIEIPTVPVVHPEWSKNAAIYEMNIRQFSEKGDFESVIPHLDRIKEMGIDIIWLMPIHPIGEEKRKGGMGSYYSVKDYKEVNPEFGTKEDFKRLVEEIHNRDMKVILDWVANHSAWDNPWIQNEGWYTTDSAGNVIAPVEDWSDVADLNYENTKMQAAMLDALRYWVTDFDVDGYRCDVAYFVPTEFWNTVRSELDKIKPVFMLAEAEQADHHESAFDMSYTWAFMHVTNDIAKGEKNLDSLRKHIENENAKFNADAYRMYFTTNHDENSWAGTVFERYGEAHKMYAAMAFTFPGMPLVYGGQESGMDKRLAFFEKDQIEWNDYSLMNFYSSLLYFKKENEALWNGNYGGKLVELTTSAPDDIFAYKREKNGNEVVVILNFAKGDVEFTIKGYEEGVTYGLIDGGQIMIKSDEPIGLKENGYLILKRI